MTLGGGEGIQLGDAIWNITGDTSGLNQSLEQSSAAVEETGGFFDRNSTRIGAAVGAAGAAITAVFAKATTDFASGAHEMGMLQEQTGFAAESLGQMVRTFEDAGLGADDLRRAAFNVRREIADMSEASDESSTSLGQLGLSFAELEGLAPEEQFLRVVDALEGVEDANTRTGLASDIFRGKAEQMLLVMGDQEGTFRRLTEAQRALYTQEDIDAAARYDEAMNTLNKALEDLWATIGRELLPELTKLVEWLGEAVEHVGEWIRENPELTSTILKATAVIAGLGAVLGPLIVLLPGIKVAVGAMGVAFAALSGPIGIAIALIAGAIAIGYLLVTNWESVVETIQNLWEGFKNFFVDLWDGIQTFVIEAISAIGRGIGRGMRAVVDAVMDPIGTIRAAWEAIVQAFQWAWEQLRNILGWMGDAISRVLGFMGDLFGAFGAGVAEGFQADVNVNGGAGMGGSTNQATINVDARGAFLRDESDMDTLGRDIADHVGSQLAMAGA